MELIARFDALGDHQTLTIGVRGGPDSIDPHFTATGTHAEALKHVFDTLVWSATGSSWSRAWPRAGRRSTPTPGSSSCARA
jgi:hypothetical protein